MSLNPVMLMVDWNGPKNDLLDALRIFNTYPKVLFFKPMPEIESSEQVSNIVYVSLEYDPCKFRIWPKKLDLAHEF
jgi:hypothetical protein